MTDSKNWLPSPGRRIILVILVTLIVVTAVNLSKKENIEKDTPTIITLGDGSTTLEISDIDTDGDGLRDWEEILWGTNPNIPDSDGDGTPDGLEVQTGRNPSIPAPGDTFDISAALLFSTSSIESQDLTQTEKFSLDFITTYINSQLVGGSFTDQVDEFAQLAVQELPDITTHSETELNVANNSSAEVVHKYGNAVGGILKKNAPGTENELVIILKAFESEDEEILEDLLTTTASYKKNAQELLKITVPQEIATQHINLINSFLYVGRDIEYIALLFDDPLASLSGLNSYFATSEELIDSLSALGTYLTNKTSFTPSEDGYVLTSNL